MRKFFKPGIRLNGFTTEAGYYSSAGLFNSDSLTTRSLKQYNATQTAGISIAGIPLLAEYVVRGSSPSILDRMPGSWYKVSFDLKQYQEQWKKMAENLSPESITNSGKKFTALSNSFKQNLRNGIIQRMDGLRSRIPDSLIEVLNPLEYTDKSPKEIAALLYGQDIPSLLSDAVGKKAALENASIHQHEKDSLLRDIELKIQELKQKEICLGELIKTVHSADSSGVITEMKGLYVLATEEYNELLNNPAALVRKMASRYKLGGLEKLFTVLSQLKLGGQSLPFTDNYVSPYLSKGISFEINIKDKFIGFSTGRLLPVLNDLQLNIPDSILAQQSGSKPSFWHLNYRKGLAAENHKGIKLTNIKNAGSPVDPLQTPELIKKSQLLVSLYSRERVAGNHWLSAELSKSLSISPQQFSMDNSGRLLGKETGYFDWSNISLKIKAEGQDERIGLTHAAYFNKIIGTYAGVVSNYTATDGYETGMMLRVKKKASRLSSYAKGTYRQYKVPGFTDSKWSSADWKIRFGYKLKKGQYIQFSSGWHDGYKRYWLANTMRNIRQQNRTLTGDISLVNKRIFGLFNTSFVSLGLQRDIFPLTGVPDKQSMASTSYTLILNQTFLYKEHLLLANFNFTRVSQEMNDLLYNTRFDADLGGSFRVNPAVSAGISVVYGYLKDAYTNMGIRASFSGQVWKRIQVDVNTDIRANLRLANPLFRQCMNLGCGIKYSIK
ncbi:MAG: hypothetical protein J0M10_09770 [Chitinophagales bacterium]|nr:hypothetical protein [Chitinophagales bacterium]